MADDVNVVDETAAGPVVPTTEVPETSFTPPPLESEIKEPNAVKSTGFTPPPKDSLVIAPEHSDAWNKMQIQSAQKAVEAGLPETYDTRQRLIDAIGQVEKAGFKTPHFIGLENEPTGDRGVTMDLENLVKSLKAQENSLASGEQRDTVSKQRAYWEGELKTGMTAEQWKSQTGEEDPGYPGTFTPPKLDSEIKDIEQKPLPEATFFEKAKRFSQDIVNPANLLLSPQDKNYGSIVGALESTARSIFRSPTEAVGEFLKSNAALDTVIAKKLLGSYGLPGQALAALVPAASESPVAKVGQYLTDSTAQQSPLPEGFENSLVFNKIPSTVARLPIYAALGAALPVVFGIDSFKVGMDVAAEQGLSESEQIKSGLFYGGTAAAVGVMLPMLSRVSSWGAFGKDAAIISRGLAKPTLGQVAKFTGLEAAQQIPLFGSQTVFDNLYSGKPWDEGLGESIATTLPLVLLSGHVFSGTRSSDIHAVDQAKANIMNRLYATQVAIETGAKKGSSEYNQAYEDAVLYSIKTQTAALAAAKASLNESGGTTPEIAKTIANDVLVNASLNLPSNKNEQTKPQETPTKTPSDQTQIISESPSPEATGPLGTVPQAKPVTPDYRYKNEADKAWWEKRDELKAKMDAVSGTPEHKAARAALREYEDTLYTNRGAVGGRTDVNTATVHRTQDSGAAFSEPISDLKFTGKEGTNPNGGTVLQIVRPDGSVGWVVKDRLHPEQLDKLTKNTESNPNEKPIQPKIEEGGTPVDAKNESAPAYEVLGDGAQGTNVGEVNVGGIKSSEPTRPLAESTTPEQHTRNPVESGTDPLTGEPNATTEGQVKEGVSPQSGEADARRVPLETSVSDIVPPSGGETQKAPQEVKPAGPYNWRKAFLDKFEPHEQADANKALDYFLGKLKEKPDISPDLLGKAEGIISEGLGPKPPPEVAAGEGGGSEPPGTPPPVAEAVPTPEPKGPPPIPEPQRKLGPGAANIEEPLAPISRGKSFMGQVKSKVRELFTQAGNLPKKVFERKIQKDASIQEIVRQSQFVSDRFERSIKDEFGSFKKVPENFLNEVNDALAGQKPIEGLPQKVQDSVREMRAHIDTLSQRLVREGVISGDLVAKIEAGFGSYLTRSYQKFDDPEWFKKVPEDVVNRAKSLIRRNIENEYITRRTNEINKDFADKAYLADPSVQADIVSGAKKTNEITTTDRSSDLYQHYLEENRVKANSEAMNEVGPASEFSVNESEINGIINHLLVKDTESPIAILKNGKVGSKDLSILKARKDIAPEIRALYGEYKDPRINYTKSIARMAQLLENHAFLNEVRTEGLGKFLFKNPTGEFYEPIAAEESSVMSPLNGLHTTPEIKAAFENVKRAEDGAFMRAYLIANSVVKYAKTIASPATHGMNLLSNVGFLTANGNFNPGGLLPAAKSILADLGAWNSPSWQQEHLKLVKLGVVGEGAIAGELKDAIRDWTKDKSNDKLGFISKSLKGLQKAYGVEDDLFKIIGFYSELASLKKALPDAAPAEVERRAAEIIREVYPNYALAPEATRQLRKFPLAATFITWNAEIARVTTNILSRTASEIRDPNPGIRAMGYRRLAGMAAQIAFISGTSAFFRQINGVDSQDDKNIRKFLPPWTENSELWFTNDDKQGRFGIIDGSRYDPYAVIKKPFFALMRGEDWAPALSSALKETFNPFFSEGIVPSKIYDIARNKQANGKPVYNAQGSAVDIAKEVGAHIWGAVEPGLITSARRIVKGYNKEVSPTGRAYDFKEELLAATGAGRKTSIDVGQSLTFKARVFNQQLGEANQILLQSLRSGNVSAEEKATSRAKTEEARQKLYSQISDYYQSAIKLGVPVREAQYALKRAGLSNDAVRLVTSGVYRPYVEPKKYQTGPYATKP